MSIFGTTVDRLERQNAADMARVANLQREIEAIERGAPSADFEAVVARDEQLTVLKRQIALAQGVASRSAAMLVEAREEAQREADDAAHRAEEKAAAADAKHIRKADTLARELADLLSTIHASRVRTEAVNARRGSRPYILDAETRVRETPARTIPPVYRDEEIWADGSGRSPMTFRRDDQGELVPVEAGFTKQTRRVEVRAETIEPAQMPERLADAIRLVDVQGKTLLPR